jgi:aminopeptidase N
MKTRYFLLPLGLLVLSFIGCNASKNTVQSDSAETTEYRMLDTMMVSAARNVETSDTIIEPTYKLPTYRASHTRTHDLLHTSLRLRFNWEKEQVIGQAELKLAPYFYPSSTLVLDAKGFEFSKIRMVGASKDLDYDYDGQQLMIDLGKTYQKGEEYTLAIDYIATPAASGGSSAITSDKGLFFIDPRDEDPEKPTQIWTQGETEHNSRWFPTIDKPNERTTQEMFVTVEDNYEVLSNGTLISEKANGDGTKTWHWKMDLPHAPYLFMLAIGEFAVVEESWEGKPVTYYVEPEYEEDATAIFSNTKEMLSFFSDKMGVKYPWPKYAQVVVRDYVSGAMENTSAVIFGEFVQRHKRELIDDHNERIVAHELIHHWFGDLVTTESWANLTMNEGFANYGEYLWFEHKYGREEADYHLLGEWAGYLSSARGNIHPLIHFGYEDKEDMFDAHSYNKGGSVLHMLRKYVGDDAFWAGLNRYLTDNAYTAVEAHNLRLAFEEVTGEDMNWFFNQWYFDQGHPRLEVSKDYDPTTGTLTLTVEQLQDAERMPAVFQLPVDVDIYTAEGEVERKKIFVDQRKQSFTFEVDQAPKLVNFDAERALLAEVEFEKSEEELVFQYYNGPLFLDRYEAILEMRQSSSPVATQLLGDALEDDFWNIRAVALGNLPANVGEAARNKMAEIASTDPHSDVRASAYQKLAELGDNSAVAVAQLAIEQDSAYNVIGAALQYLAEFEPAAALKQAKLLENETSPDLLMAVGELYAATGDSKYLPFFKKNMAKVDGYAAISFAEGYKDIALKGDLNTAEEVGQHLHQLAIDESTSPWVRFGATRALNQIRQSFEASEDEAEQSLGNDFLSLLKEIVAKEKSSQLQSFYSQMLPDVKP